MENDGCLWLQGLLSLTPCHLQGAGCVRAVSILAVTAAFLPPQKYFKMPTFVLPAELHGCSPHSPQISSDKREQMYN